MHHGNGTQDIFWADKSRDVLLDARDAALSRHRRASSERGEHNNIVNAPLRAGDGGDAFREAFETAILPRLRAFKPDILVISAGFDAHTRDPLANLNLVEADFSLGHQEADGDRRRQRAGARRLDAGRRLRSAGAVALGRGPRHRANARLKNPRYLCHLATT